MNVIQKILINSVDDFKLCTYPGRKLWAPYIRNATFYHQDENALRGLGKSYPFEIQNSVDYICSKFEKLSDNEIRIKLVDGSLEALEHNYKGVDCSGFAFILYEKILKNFGYDLCDDLIMLKNDVIRGSVYDEWRSTYELSEYEAGLLPREVPVSWVVEKFKRKPISLCRVAGFMADKASRWIDLSEAKIGDMVYMKNSSDLDHIAIVIGVNHSTLEIVHSSRRDDEKIGGVRFESLIDINSLDDKDHRVIGIKRLKSLDKLLTNLKKVPNRK